MISKPARTETNSSPDKDDAPAEAPASVTESAPELVEGDDYYWEGPAMVFTANFLLRRGYCCDNGCRHCPYSNVER